MATSVTTSNMGTLMPSMRTPISAMVWPAEGNQRVVVTSASAGAPSWRSMSATAASSDSAAAATAK